MNLNRALTAAVDAAQTVGGLMSRQLHSVKRANEVSQHDIKLELDVRSQKLIQKMLYAAFPDAALLGEEGVAGDASSEYRWVVDPIDGTVNFAYTIPHACVSIALQRQGTARAAGAYEDGFQTLLGVVYDPFCDELWTAVSGQAARLNSKIIRVSRRRKLDEAIVSIGFAKSRENLEATLPYFIELVHRVRKIRIMGSAALALTYVASGRFDAYIERGIRLWDVAAGGLILECAGGEFWHRAVPGEHAYRMIATNGLVRKQLRIPE
ncbi:MAG TPA: inositol monophosphatase family protein [Verrucomicrobiae bacterium]|nr:inositol monophosphatase family protein [Verrucomicrobiae bacterium]